MSRRTERIESLIRSTLGQLLLTKMSDPRVNPALTSITRVEVPEDLLTAKVFISVMGTENQQKTALAALRHAAGHMQQLMKGRVQLRNTPILDFQLDVRFKKTVQTLDLIQKAMDEIRQKEEQNAPPAAEPPADADADDDVEDSGDEGAQENPDCDPAEDPDAPKE